jgi:GWxTD domain-containing protein
MQITLCLSLIASVFAAIEVRGQAPAGSATLTAEAVADSLRILRTLDGAVRTNPGDAAAWHRRGMIAWALYERDRSKPPVAGLDWTLLGRLADTSLRIAAQIDTANPAYRVAAGRFLLMSGVSITRVAAYGFFEAALEAARASGDPRILAEAAVEAGRVRWRRYDSMADRVSTLSSQCGGSIPAIAYPDRDSSGHATGERLVVQRDRLRQNTMSLSEKGAFPGEGDYIQAELLFREALDAAPSSERAYRQLAMLLVERKRWTELGVAARARIGVAPQDAWAWLTLGLASQRGGGQGKVARDAFERGLALLPAAERGRLDQLERILRPADTARVAAFDVPTRSAMQQLYWMSADPLWSRDESDSRAEFLARLTYAELRWSVEEMEVRGADTDRGDVHIRYGPADLVWSVKPPLCEIATYWAYNSGLGFTFVGQPTFATARFPFSSAPEYVDAIRGTPVLWDNIRTVRVDTMPIQAARFRAAQDSVDLFFAVMPPVDRIRNAADVAGSVRTDFWLLQSGLVTVARDSAMIDTGVILTYRVRIGPGNYVYRTEASADGASYAGRATGALAAGTDAPTGFDIRGFGMSDVITAARAPAGGAATRWSDLAIEPIVGTVVSQGRVTLVWENYELGSDAGSARYTVSITVARRRSRAGRIAAEIIGRAGSTIGIDRTDDRVTTHYERTVAHSPVVLDNIELALGDTPEGDYLITVGILDRVTGRETSSSIPLTVIVR